MDTTNRVALLRELTHLGRQVIFGSISETYRTCGQSRCRCHRDGPKHGPYLQISYRGESGKTTGYHVPPPLANSVREGIAAWRRLQEVTRELSELNRRLLWASYRRRSRRDSTKGRRP